MTSLDSGTQSGRAIFPVTPLSFRSPFHRHRPCGSEQSQGKESCFEMESTKEGPSAVQLWRFFTVA